MKNRHSEKEGLGWIKNMLHHSIVSDAGIFAVSQYTAAGLGFFATVVAARILGPDNYGVATLVMAYPMLIWSLMSIKSVSVTTRYISSFRATGQNEEIKSICKLGYGIDFFLSLVTFILVSATAWWAARHMYILSGKAWLMIVYAASFPLLSLMGTSWAVLSSFGKWRLLAVFQILDQVITFIIVFGLLLSNFGVGGVILGTATGQVIFGLLMLAVATYILYRDGFGLWWKASLSSVVSLRKELTTFFGWQYLIISLNGLLGQVPLMLLGYLRGPKEAGFFRLATSFTIAGTYLELSLGKVIYPILSGYWGRGEREGLKSILQRWTLQAGLPIGVLLLLTIPLFPMVVSLVFSSSYRPMILSAQVMMAGVAVSAVFFWLINLYYASGRISLWAKGYAFYTAIVIGLGWLCIQQWGFLGLAILITVARVVFTLSMAMGFKESPLRRSKPQGRDSIYNHKIVCFTFWFPIHNNPRYSGLIPKLICKVKFYKVTLSRHRLIRALQYHLWVAIKNKFIYPVVLWFLGRRHATLFCVDVHQITAWPRNKSVVMDIDDPSFSPTEIRNLNLPQVKAIIVAMEKMRAIYQQLGVVQPIYVIPHGVAMEYIDPYKIEQIRVRFKRKNDLVVGYLAPTLTLSCDGYHRARQGLDDLDFLFAAVKGAREVDHRIKLWLFGEPSKSLRKYVVQGHGSWIKLFGYIDYCDILNYLSNFDIAVYPRTKRDIVRYREKIGEYMTCGIPIISTNFEEGPPIILKEAGCGIICDSQEDFTKALLTLARSSEMRQELGRGGQRYAAANLDLSILTEQYKQILSQV